MPDASLSGPPVAVAKAGGRRRFTVDALFVDSRPQAVGVSDLPTAKEIRLDRIEADPDQPRRTFDEAKLEELAASIRIEGVLQPIVVRYERERDVYVIVHGERRWRASREAERPSIPAIVRDVPHDRRLIQQLMENIVRDDLNAIDRAAALRALKGQLKDAPWEQVAQAVGIRRSRLFQLLGTEKLPESIQDDIRAGRISEKQSRALQGLSPGHQSALRDAIVAGDLPVEEALQLARALKSGHVPDDPREAASAIAHLRSARESQPGGREDGAGRGADELATLLAAIADAATGGQPERANLKRLADGHGAPAFDVDRLRADVLALAKSLARIPPVELRAGTAAYATLAALFGALDAALG